MGLFAAFSKRGEPQCLQSTLADAPFSYNCPIHMPSHGCRRTVGGGAEQPAGVGGHAVSLTAFNRREKVPQELCIFTL